MGDVRRQTLSGVKWSAIERLAIQGMQFVIGLVLARLLSPDDFGLVGMIAILLSVSQTLIDSGFSNALVRKQDRSQVDCSTAFYFNVAVGIVLVVIMYFISPWIALFFERQELVEITRAVSVVLLFNSLAVVQTALFTAAVDFKSQAHASIWATLFSGIVGITCASCGMGVWALVWQSVCSAVVRCLVLWISSKWLPSWIFSVKSFREMFSYGSKLMASGLLGVLYNHMSTILIGKFYTASDLGYYTRGMHFANLPSVTVTGVLQRVTFPVLAKFQNDDEHLIRIYRKYIRFSSMFIFFALCLLAALARPLVLFLLTEKWEPAVVYLQLFCLSALVTHIPQINLNLLQVKGRSDLYLQLEVIKKTVSTLLLLCAVPFGVLAICVSNLVYSQISLVVNTYYTGKLFHLGYWMQFKDFGGYLLMAVLSAVPVYFLGGLPIPSIAVLCIGAVVGCCVYGGILWIRKDGMFMEYVVLPVVKYYKNKIKKK